MKIIRELVRIASTSQVSKLIRVNRARAHRPVMDRYFAALKEGNLRENEIVANIYGKEKDTSYPPYRALKSRMREILTSVVLSDNTYSTNYRTYDAAYENGYRQLHLIKILIVKRAWKAVLSIALTTFRRVRKYEIIPLNHELTGILAGVYLGIGYNEKKFTEYQELTDHYASALIAQSKVESYYRQMRSMLYAHRLLPDEIGARVITFTKECEPLAEAYREVSLIQSMFYNLKVTGLMLTGQYRAAIGAADEGQTMITSCYGVSKKNVSIMALTRVECSIKLGSFEEGYKQAERASSLIPPRSINHIKLSQYMVDLGLETGHYDYAYQELQKVDWNDIQDLLTKQHVEYWLILEAYVNLLRMAGWITGEKKGSTSSSFKLSRFLNDVPSYSKNKQGMNIQILLIQVVFLIIQQKYGKVIDRTAALTRYGSRYLTSNENLRNNCFFKMLVTAERCRFHRVATERHTAKIYQRMISKEAKELAKANSTELVAYEDLWQIVLDHLEVKSVDGRKLRSQLSNRAR